MKDKPQVSISVLGLEQEVSRKFVAEVIRSNRWNRKLLKIRCSEKRYPKRHGGTPGIIRALLVKNSAGGRIARFTYVPAGATGD